MGKLMAAIIIFMTFSSAHATSVVNIDDVDVGDVVQGVVRIGSNNIPLAEGKWRIAQVEDGRVKSDDNLIAGDRIYALFESELNAGQYLSVHGNVDVISGAGWNTTACDKGNAVIFLNDFSGSYSYPECVKITKIPVKGKSAGYYLASYVFYGKSGFAKVDYYFPEKNGVEEDAIYLSRLSAWVTEMGKASRVSLRDRDNPVQPRYFRVVQ